MKQEPSTDEQLRAKLQRAIKAAQSADDQLRQQGLLMGGSSRKEDLYCGELLHSTEPTKLNTLEDKIICQCKGCLEYSDTIFYRCLFSPVPMPCSAKKEHSYIFNPYLLLTLQTKVANTKTKEG